MQKSQKNKNLRQISVNRSTDFYPGIFTRISQFQFWDFWFWYIRLKIRVKIWVWDKGVSVRVLLAFFEKRPCRFLGQWLFALNNRYAFALCILRILTLSLLESCSYLLSDDCLRKFIYCAIFCYIDQFPVLLTNLYGVKV